jgi:hypothetical protein
MITEIVKFSIPEDMSHEDVVAGFESTAITWKENPDLIRKNYLVDVESRTAGGVYLWKSKADAQKWHGEEFKARVKAKYGSEPRFEYFETPVVVDNVVDAVVKG